MRQILGGNRAQGLAWPVRGCARPAPGLGEWIKGMNGNQPRRLRALRPGEHG
jgi:hypothetical protein